MPNHKTQLSRRGVAGLILVLLAGCAGETELAGGHKPPPPVPAETVPKPPVSEDPLIWQPGHWDWNGTGYDWRPGLWVKREGHGTQWQDGYWGTTGGTWAWIPAHWL